MSYKSHISFKYRPEEIKKLILDDIKKHGYELDGDINIVMENEKFKYFELEVTSNPNLIFEVCKIC
jgi:hypothetical protein